MASTIGEPSRPLPQPGPASTQAFWGDDVGSFEYDVRADRWRWSPELYALHGYEAGAVAPSVDLVVRHKVPEDRRRAERLFTAVREPGFQFRNRHEILDVRGRRRQVVTVAAVWGDEPVVRGFMLDVTALSAGVQAQLVRSAPAPTPATTPAPMAALAALTERERQVLELLADGLSNAEIAAGLFVSVNTVKTYLRSAYRKTGATRRSQAVRWVLESRAADAASSSQNA